MSATTYKKTASRLSISVLGNSLGAFFAVTLGLCVLFDLIFPGYAMNQVWSPLFPGFVWLTWSGFVIGLVESFAYGWYAAIILVPLYNFFASRSLRTIGT
ncbi:MAG TPA: hypothetical protein ENI69_08675 [Rhodospirillales bacterium]|nr:hypothetical protein [Rhodospirillales bacterium]